MSIAKFWAIIYQLIGNNYCSIKASQSERFIDKFAKSIVFVKRYADIRVGLEGGVDYAIIKV